MTLTQRFGSAFNLNVHVHRAQIVRSTHAVAECGEAAATDRQRAMSRAQRPKRVFASDIGEAVGHRDVPVKPAGNAAIGCASSPASRRRRSLNGLSSNLAAPQNPSTRRIRAACLQGGLVLLSFARFDPGPTDCVANIRPLVLTIRPSGIRTSECSAAECRSYP